jgi:hypothetical protein
VKAGNSRREKLLDVLREHPILPTNRRSLNPAPDKRSAQTGQLLARSGMLHAVRSVLSGLALLLFLYLVIFAKPL